MVISYLSFSLRRDLDLRIVPLCSFLDLPALAVPEEMLLAGDPRAASFASACSSTLLSRSIQG